jgi:hypothetical protein
VAGAIGHRSRRAVPDQGIVEVDGNGISMALLGKFLLFDKGVAVEPFEQGASIRRHHLALHIVQMQVDKAWHDQVGAMVDDDRTGRLGL